MVFLAICAHSQKSTQHQGSQHTDPFPKKKKSLVVQKVYNFFLFVLQDQHMRNEKAVNTGRNFNSSKQGLKCCENLFILLCRTWGKYCPLFPLLSKSRGNKIKYFFWEKNTPQNPSTEKKIKLLLSKPPGKKTKTHLLSTPKGKKNCPLKKPHESGYKSGHKSEKNDSIPGEKL